MDIGYHYVSWSEHEPSASAKKTALGIAVQVRRDAAADAKAWPRGLNAEGFLSEVSQDGKAGRLFNDSLDPM